MCAKLVQRVQVRWSSSYRGTCSLAHRQQAQGTLEFALAIPIFLALMFVSIQFSAVLAAQAAVVWVTNSVARHIATGSQPNWMLADSCHTTFRNQQIGNFPILRAANVTTFQIQPSYTPTTANCTTAASNSPATTRVRGNAIQVTIQYSPSNLMFLPTTFLGIPVMSTLPAYTSAAVME